MIITEEVLKKQRMIFLLTNINVVSNLKDYAKNEIIKKQISVKPY